MTTVGPDTVEQSSNGPRRSATSPNAPPTLRRRPRQIVAGVAVTVAAGIGGVLLFDSLGETEPVIVVSQTVARGQVITEDALAVTHITPSPELATIPGDQIDEVVGQRAGADLTPGSILVPDAVTNQTVPSGDSSLVPIALPSTKLPNELLLPGDTVQIVLTPAQNQEVAEDPPSVDATVSSIGEPDSSDMVVIDVIVNRSDAAIVASYAASERAALVLHSRDQGAE